MFFDLISGTSVSAVLWTFAGACGVFGLAIGTFAYAINRHNKKFASV